MRASLRASEPDLASRFPTTPRRFPRIILAVSDWPGVEDREAREVLLRGLANSLRFWQEHGVLCAKGVVPPFASSGETQAIEVLAEAVQTAEQHDALRLILGTCLSGLVHSALVELDGGSSRATIGRPHRRGRQVAWRRIA